MNGVTVPKAYEHLVRTPKQTTEDYKAKIRHYIEARPNQALTNANFQELLGTTSAMAHINRLMKQGHIVRARIRKGRGKRYSYKWHDTPLDYETAAKKNGLVIVSSLNLPEFALRGKLPDLTALFTEWVDTLPQPINGDHIAGVVMFRRWLTLKEKEVEEIRKAKLDEHTTSRRTTAMDSTRTE